MNPKLEAVITKLVECIAAVSAQAKEVCMLAVAEAGEARADAQARIEQMGRDTKAHVVDLEETIKELREENEGLREELKEDEE